MRRGFLIVLTGIDGSGKTTQAQLLIEDIKRKRKDVTYVWSRWEPSFLRPLVRRIKKKRSSGGATSTLYDINEMKEKKNRLLRNPLVKCLWLGAFFFDYGLQMLLKIRIRLFKKIIIVSDRIYYDSLIDQVISLGEKNIWLLDSLDSLWMNIFFPKPDMVIYIDCPEEVAFSRKNDLFTPDMDYFKGRRELYLKMAEKYQWTKLDGTVAVDEVFDRVRSVVYEKIGAMDSECSSNEQIN